MATRLGDQLRRARGAARRRLKARLAANDLPPGWQNASVAALADSDLWPLRELYEGRFDPAPISYATARDFADSTDAMPGLATASQDLRNVQRCWIVKAVLGAVPRGGRLLEIGAGEPLVAGLLSRLGYQVAVVDPYDGTTQGPREYEQFAAGYPDLQIIRDRFPPAEPLDGPFDAVYTISLLQQVPADAIGGLVEAAQAVLGPDGRQVHAFDMVVAGWGADAHRELAERIVTATGLDAAALTTALAEMERDPETYFVSAEAHNRWRGNVPYESYPMRRISSLNLLSPGS